MKYATRLTTMMACICLCALFLLQPESSSAQVFKIKDGRIYIEMNKKIDPAILDSFIVRFDLTDLSLNYFLKTGITDSLKKMGWDFDMNNEKEFAISKKLTGSDNLSNITEKFLLTSKEPGYGALFPAVNNGTLLGYNRFKNKAGFLCSDSVVTFFLRNNSNKVKVMLAGSFNNWDITNTPMTKTDSGWITNVTLRPGKYWYKFYADGKWQPDNDNQLRENDAMGNTNSVYYKTNYLFRLDTFTNAKRIYLAGSFNNWNEKDIQLKRTSTGWELPVYLADGTHTYKYIVDGQWTFDFTNPDRFPNEFNDFNSVIHLGKLHNFYLNGYEHADKVLLTGSFNYWRKDELYMKKTASGWELSYSLGPGNYEYRFIVDGKEIIDPDNSLTVNNYGNENSYLILEPNYTFKLKGYPNAKSVYLAADFNNFSVNYLAMKKTGDEWQVTVHLNNGKHIYKYIVDNQWILDPGNELWEQNRFGTGNSVLWIGE